MSIIYLDHAATTPIDSEVNDLMYKVTSEFYANPSSLHSGGQKCKFILEKSRATIAESINCLPAELVFTSGGTEANNLAILGAVNANSHLGNHLITSRIEHPSVLNVFQYLETIGYEVSYITFDRDGQMNTDEIKSLLRGDTILVSLMLANNETGCISPIQEIGQILEGHPAYFHCDAVQAFGKMEIYPTEINVDLLTVSAHKIYGPKGAGALFIRNSVLIDPPIYGGSQESNLRPGTENIAAIAGFACAAELSTTKLETASKIASLRNQFEQNLKKIIPDIFINGESSKRICSHSNVYFPFISGDAMLINLDQQGIAVSTGSACSSGSSISSHVLEAMGFNPIHIKNSLRFSFGRDNTYGEIEILINIIKSIHRRIVGN